MADDLPIACSLEDRALAERTAALRTGILATADAVERLADGYRWRFRSEAGLFARLGAVIDAERQCCRFLRFAIETEPGLGKVTLEVTGPSGTADFLDSWIAAPPT